MTQFTALEPDEPGIAGGCGLEPALLDDEAIAALYAGRRYDDEPDALAARKAIV